MTNIVETIQIINPKTGVIQQRTVFETGEMLVEHRDASGEWKPGPGPRSPYDFTP